MPSISEPHRIEEHEPSSSSHDISKGPRVATVQLNKLSTF